MHKKHLAVIKYWLLMWPKLFWEIFLFFVNIPHYLYNFFSGLRLFSESYDRIILILKEQQRLMENVKSRNNKNLEDIKTMVELISRVEGYKKEQQEIFTGLFGILIAVLALFISVSAFLIRK